MNFLQLCQRTAQESGTISGSTLPSAVTAQNGRLKKVVDWTATAWTMIQDLHPDWFFLQAELPGTSTTTASTAKYTPASFSIADLAQWIVGDDRVTIYKQSLGVADETPITRITWAEWRARYNRGVQVNNRPIHYAISPANEICFGPVPDATYVVKGEYRKTATLLAANGDTPSLPDRFHMIIVWRAVMLLGDHDEAAVAIGTAQAKYLNLLSGLRLDQLPQIGTAGPLA